MRRIASLSSTNRRSATVEPRSRIGNADRFYVYIMGNETNGKLAVSMTQDLQTRVRNQKNDLHPQDFTSVNSIHSLLRVEEFSDLCEALARYNHLRSLDVDDLSWLATEENPGWHDLFQQYSDETARA